MKVLGIDPGIERLGWAVVEKTEQGPRRIASGVERTSAKHPHGERLLQLSRFLESRMKEVGPERIAIEKIFFKKNAKTAISIGEIRGIALSLAAKFGLGVLEFSPSEVKLLVAGYGKADKKSVARMVGLSLALDKTRRLDDETDALALALCGVFHKNYP